MIEDPDSCWRALQARDERFDGRFITGVRTTGIYCRPSCPAVTPRRSNVVFLQTAAAAQAAGFRACLRCRPDATPGSPEWRTRGDVAARAMRLIAEGVVDRDGVAGLARRLAFSERQLHRILVRELGAGPIALARAQRAQTARTLIETTPLSFVDVAAAAGFASVRQFNATIREIYARSPGELRRAAHGGGGQLGPGVLSLRLPFRSPLAAEALLDFLGERALPAVEEREGGVFRRALRLPHGAGVVELEPADGHVACRLRLSDLRDLAACVAACRRLLDLDADPVAVDALLAEDPALAAAVAAAPGLRVPGTVDGFETACRAVLGQQVSVRAARTLAGRIAERWGTPLEPMLGGSAGGSVQRLFPAADTLAGVDPAELAMPRRRAETLVRLARAVAEGSLQLDPGVDRDEAAAALGALAGIGPWTVQYVGMRALADPDAFPATDLGVLHGARALALDDLERSAEGWRPWRAYAVQHLWRAAAPAASTLAR